MNFTNSTIQFTADQSYNLAVPNAQITFSPSASCATTSFDSITNTWMTTVPVSGNDEIFLSGLAFPVPSGFGKVNGNVAWSGTFSSSTGGVSMHWKWGAAVYTTFTTDYNALNISFRFHSAINVNRFLARLLALVTKGRISPRRAAVLSYITNQLIHSPRRRP